MKNKSSDLGSLFLLLFLLLRLKSEA